MPVFSRFHRYFMAVGRLGSIRRAADELNVSASAIDRQILQAEAQLGLPLFERLPTGLRLTAAGELVMTASAGWNRGLADLRAQIEDLRGLRRGHVEIAVIDALARGIVPDRVRQIRAEYPGISIGLRVLDNAEVRAAIVGGAVDFGILLNPQAARDLVVRSHMDVVLGFVTRPGHPLAGEPAQRFSACAAFEMVMPMEPLAVAQQIAALEAATDMKAVVAAGSDNIQMVKSLVSAGVGVGVLSSIDVADEVAKGELAFTPISDRLLNPLTLALCAVPARQLSAAAHLVLAGMEDAISRSVAIPKAPPA